ncbi:reticulon-3-B-like isoform X2 [Dunckerocampus dactyliophorus]|nr:reticulon-3-B-like isoform X2 [Dunckerocampus dactyliophorus]
MADSSSSSSLRRDLTRSGLQLIQWEDPRKSAAVLGLSLLVLVSLAMLSAITVVSYVLLACLCVTITFRVYKSFLQAVSKSQQGHPFQSLLDQNISLSPDSVRMVADTCTMHVNQAAAQARRLLLVEDLVDSLKLAAVMWLMTYVGAIFNAVTVLILVDIIAFTTPLIYKKRKAQIDEHVHVIRSKMDDTLHKLLDKLPGAVKRINVE